MQARLWHIENESLRLELPRFGALVDPNDPARGLHEVLADAQPLADVRALAVRLRAFERGGAAGSMDYFLRGGDLAVTYADRPDPAMRTQIYWRAASHPLPGAIAAIELVVSVQTSMLDSCPKLETHSHLVAERAFRLRNRARGKLVEIVSDAPRESHDHATQPQAYLFHLPGGKLSYAEMIHPADAQAARYASQLQGAVQRIELSHELFAERLEKGVILRARILGLFLDRAGDEAAAAEHFAAFLAAELPLTT